MTHIAANFVPEMQSLSVSWCVVMCGLTRVCVVRGSQARSRLLSRARRPVRYARVCVAYDIRAARGARLARLVYFSCKLH